MRVFRQKGCKTYRVRFSVGLQKFDLPLKTPLKEVAEEKARKLVREKERELAGLSAPKAQIETAQTPLVDLLKDWLENGLSPEVTAKHRRYSEIRPRRLFEECGWRFVRDITPDSFEAWRNRKRREGSAPKTLNEYLAHVRSFLKWLEGRQRIEINPLRIVENLRVVREEPLRAFTLDELEALVESVPDYRACVYTVAAFTGLRRGELHKLEWSRVVLDDGTPRIELKAATTKNRKGETLPLHADAVAALVKLRELAPANEERVFFKAIPRMPRFRKDIELAGIAETDARGRSFVFHSLRRTCSTFLNAAGAPPRVTMELMRHSDMRLTMRDYTDQTILPLAAALENVPSLKSSPVSSPKIGKSCPGVSIAGISENETTQAQPLGSEVARPPLTPVVHPWPNPVLVREEGFEPPTASV